VAVTVLIVDDSSEFRAAISELFDDRGLVIIAAVATPQEALKLASRRCPDGILVDLDLSGADGIAVATTLGAACPNATIVLTSATVGYLPDSLIRTSAAAAFVSKDALAGADLDALFKPADT
jgi:two-component system response regulator DesR